jgi:hypothetical protein
MKAENVGAIPREDVVMPLSGQMFNFFKSLVTIIVHNLGPECNESEIIERKNICDKCQLKDLKGDRLFRTDNKSTILCGVFFLNKKIRDPKKEGCGCLLSIKWKKRWGHCPNELW